MRAEIISIGDEMTTGQRLDTNAQWLSQRCAEIGLDVAFHTTVGDNFADHLSAFQIARDRVAVVIASGGLGPTADDLTRQVLAATAQVPLERDSQSVAQIEAIFSKLRRPMPESNLVQADFPRGSRPIHNPNGTAPGIAMTLAGRDHPCTFFCLPGVPAEMFEMWHADVAPALSNLLGRTQSLFVRVLNCFGAGESQIESMLPGLIDRQRVPRVGITASLATISLRILVWADSEASAEAQFAPTETFIRDQLGELVFGIGDQTLPDIVAAQLCQANQSIALVDFGLHGLPATWLSQAEFGSRTLRGAIAMNGRPELAQPSDPSRWVQQAEETRLQFGADWGLAIGPLQSTADRATFVASLVGPDLVAQQELIHAGHPSLRWDRSVKQVFNFVRLNLSRKGI